MIRKEPKDIDERLIDMAPGYKDVNSWDHFKKSIWDQIKEVDPEMYKFMKDLNLDRTKHSRKGIFTYLKNNKFLPRWNRVVGEYSATNTLIRVEHVDYFKVQDVVEVTRTKEMFLVIHIFKIEETTFVKIKGYIEVKRGFDQPKEFTLPLVDGDELRVMGATLGTKESLPLSE